MIFLLSLWIFACHNFWCFGLPNTFVSKYYLMFIIVSIINNRQNNRSFLLVFPTIATHEKHFSSICFLRFDYVKAYPAGPGSFISVPLPYWRQVYQFSIKSVEDLYCPPIDDPHSYTVYKCSRIKLNWPLGHGIPSPPVKCFCVTFPFPSRKPEKGIKLNVLILLQVTLYCVHSHWVFSKWQLLTMVKINRTSSSLTHRYLIGKLVLILTYY